ncbi:MAG: ABC transporter ATP-binding protein [Phreatobacter sp.]|uniref:ABC transporter ATP-binding protein n=1 Tax=Phreatobacter sp. TaxID=1966341 RepID=UPI001A4236DB|nr:ABC transporter ATP-binding protein [Phreatobacter sp.]MBL8571953.1 ABC transporter ATP-binding protein [Phreatobacter sp.]
MTPPVIEVSGVSKAYRVFDRREDRLKELLLGRFKQWHREFWALRDISLEIRAGETVGIVGRNGSGKSTLLQIITGTMRPTTGSVQVRGRIAALLELGSGFNPEFSGIENCYLNGAILGMSRAEVDAKLPSILAFADIGEFAEQPVKTYSSGMFMRLAFAVQTHVDASIIIVDEALAVGDVFFRQKCYRRLEELREQGASVLIVTHSMGDIEEHCDRALVLDHGRCTFSGLPSQAIKHYHISVQGQPSRQEVIADIENSLASTQRPALPDGAEFRVAGLPQFNNGSARCVRVGLLSGSGEAARVFRAGESAVFVHEYVVDSDIEVPFAGVVLHSEKGTIVHGRNTLQLDAPAPSRLSAGSFVRIVQTIRLDLSPGEYTFEVGLGELPRDAFARAGALTWAEIDENRTRVVQVPDVGSFSVIWPSTRGIGALPHHGLVNLQGAASIVAFGPDGLPIDLDAGRLRATSHE